MFAGDAPERVKSADLLDGRFLGAEDRRGRPEHGTGPGAAAARNTRPRSASPSGQNDPGFRFGK